MKGKGKWLLLAAVLAFATSYVLLQVLKSNATQQVVSGTPKVSVVIATTQIDEHVRVLPTMLKIAQVSADSVPPDALHSLQDVQDAVTRQPIVAGAMLQKAMISTQDQPGSPFALQVPKGLRAVSIANNEVIGLSGLLVPEDRVDVIATYKKEQIGGKQDETKIVLQNIEVLAVGSTSRLEDALGPSGEAVNGNADNTNGSAGTTSNKTGSKPTPRTTVTLAVTPEQAESLVFADSNGTIRLALRGVDDSAKESTPGVVNDTAIKER